MGKSRLPIGIVISVTGSYRTVGQELLNGALLAIEEVGRDPDFDFAFDPAVHDPGGEPAAYREHCERLLSAREIVHVVGCYTSSSRKEAIPAIEKYDGLLWYPSHYEGFETSRNVIYTGASPNQHIVPLLRYMLAGGRRRVYCLGSNYIWAWENNRILREIVQACGGAVLAEKYLPVGATDVERFLEEIRAASPDFIFNTLIGESSYAFYRAYAETAGERPAIPVTSCSLSEPELLAIGASGAVGHIASSVYFQSIGRPANERFVSRYQARFGAGKPTSADAESSYIAVLLLAQAVRAAGTAEVEAVKKALYACRLEAPQGPVWIDPDNNHSFLTPAIGVSRADGQFDIAWRADVPMKPDPYLVWFDQREFAPRPAAAREAGYPRAVQP